MGHASEHMITNLGPVPEGMTFLEATRAMVPHRKHQINPHHQSKRLTVCETMREIWRIADRIGGPDAEVLKELAAAGYDYGKRQNNRMVELREMVLALGGEL